MVNKTVITSGENTITYQIITSEDEWEKTRPEWNCLVEKSASPSFFLTFGYLRSAWEANRNNASLHIIRIFSAETFLGIVPLKVVHRRVCGVPASTLQPIGGEESEGNFFIVLEGADSFYKVFVEYLANHFHLWSRVCFHLLDRTHPFVPLFLQAFSRDRRMVTEHREMMIHPFITIEDSWPKYVRSLKHRFMKNLRTQIRRAFREGELRVIRFSSPREISNNLVTYVQMEHRSWKTVQDSGITRTPELFKLFQEMLDRCPEEVDMDMTFLLLDNRVLAGGIGVIYCGRYVYLQTVYDESAAYLSPGIILMTINVWRAFQAGLKTLDFMGNYVEYKRKWAHDDWQSCSVSVRKRMSGEGLAYYGSRWIRPVLDELRCRLSTSHPEEKADEVSPPLVIDPDTLSDGLIILRGGDVREIFMIGNTA